LATGTTGTDSTLILLFTAQHPGPGVYQVEPGVDIIDAEEEMKTIGAPVLVVNQEECPVQEQHVLATDSNLINNAGPGEVLPYLESIFTHAHNTTDGNFEPVDFQRLLYGFGSVTHERFIEIYDQAHRLIWDFQDVSVDPRVPAAGLSSYFMSVIRTAQVHHVAFMTGYEDDSSEEDFLSSGATDFPERLDFQINIDIEPDF